MKDGRVKKVVEIGNKLIEALRVEANYNPDDAVWKLEEEHIKWINEEDLINLTQLSHEFSNRCLDLEDEIE